jgi:hypothetical protein
LNTLGFPGHSLGNMVVSSAICEYDAPVSQYYAIDAAVALEAYGDVTTNAALVPDVVFTWDQDGFLQFKRYGWNEYPFETWASEWYRLFPANDLRSQLTFRHKFADIQQKTDVFNFYSSTEDVLRVRDDVNQILQSITDIDIELFMHLIPTNVTISSQCSWQMQEMYKGTHNWAVEYGGGGSSKYTGWAFTEHEGSHIQCVSVKKPGSHSTTTKRYCEKPYQTKEALSLDPGNSEVRAAYLENLKTDPLFNRTPGILFGDQAAAFVGGKVGGYEDVLDYDNGELIGTPDIDVSNVEIRDWLLAKAFPSRTGPMGSGSNSNLVWRGVNFDMSDPDANKSFMTDPGKWRHKMPEDETKNEWRHSDWKNMPYVHVYKLFEKVTGKGN